MYEAFINGPIICLVLDIGIWYRLFFQESREFTSFIALSLLKFNLGIILFIVGITAFILLISKMFNSAGFATQIGSLLYLVPVFLSIYLKALELKHQMSTAANEKYEEMEASSPFSPGYNNLT